MIISPGLFFFFLHFFKILIFQVKGQKMAHNYQFQSVTLYISGTVDHIIQDFWYTGVE